MGKGDKQRPVNRKVYSSNYDAIKKGHQSNTCMICGSRATKYLYRAGATVGLCSAGCLFKFKLCSKVVG